MRACLSNAHHVQHGAFWGRRSSARALIVTSGGGVGSDRVRYQVCRFCWHRIRSEENGLCPACRAEYSEKPYSYEALSVEEMAKMKAEKKQKKAQKRQKDVEMRYVKRT